MNTIGNQTPVSLNRLNVELLALGLPFMAENYNSAATRAAKNGQGHADFLAGLIEGECNLLESRPTAR